MKHQAFSVNRRAIRFWWNISPAMILSTLAQTIVGALIPYVNIYFSARLIDELAKDRNPRRLWQLVLIVLTFDLVLAVIHALLCHIRDYYQKPNYESLFKSYSDKFLSMDFCDVDNARIHELYSTIRQYMNWSGWGLIRIPDQLAAITGAAAKILGAIVLSVHLFLLEVPSDSSLAYLNHPIFIILLLILMFLIVTVSPLLSSKAGSYWAKCGEEATFGNRVFSYVYTLSSEKSKAPDIRLYRQDQFCENLYGKFNFSTFTTNSHIAAYARGPMGILNLLSAAVSRVFTGIVYLFVCLKAWGGAFGIGSVTQYISAITSLSQGLSSLLQTIGEMKNNATHLRMSFDLLDTPNRMYQGSLTVEKRSDRKYEVEFRDVSFRYPGADTDTLSHVSFRFQVGERLAVVGENGSGKTTMIKLLCRLYDPTEGSILLNGIDIRKYNYAEYMAIFSVVFQDFQLMAFPLGQNVAGREVYDRKKAAQCLQDAGFDTRLSRMEKGLDTCLYREFDETGVEVSGGEAQKIAIARALFKDAPFIILDEPTAALDPIAEMDIYARFNTLIQDKTAIYISHRLSSCRFCDKIAVFDHGHIVQVGNHEQLTAEEGKYAELWEAQAQYYT